MSLSAEHYRARLAALRSAYFNIKAMRDAQASIRGPSEYDIGKETGLAQAQQCVIAHVCETQRRLRIVFGVERRRDRLML